MKKNLDWDEILFCILEDSLNVSLLTIETLAKGILEYEEKKR